MFVATFCLLLAFVCCYHICCFRLLATIACMLMPFNCWYHLLAITACFLLPPACCCRLLASTYSEFNHLLPYLLIPLAGYYQLPLVSFSVCLLPPLVCCYCLPANYNLPGHFLFAATASLLMSFLVGTTSLLAATLCFLLPPACYCRLLPANYSECKPLFARYNLLFLQMLVATECFLLPLACCYLLLACTA